MILKDWKLKLRYGLIKTPYQHRTLIAEVLVREIMEGYSCNPGKAFIGVCMWSQSNDEAAYILHDLGNHLGFEVTGSIEFYVTDPKEPPGDMPSAYSIKFTSFDGD